MVEGDSCDENSSGHRRLSQFIFLWNTYSFAKHGFQIKHNYEISYPFEWGRILFFYILRYMYLRIFTFPECQLCSKV